jgi:hypothetical protein
MRGTVWSNTAGTLIESWHGWCEPIEMALISMVLISSGCRSHRA